MIRSYQSALLERAGFTEHGFTKRTGGVSSGDYESLNIAYGVGDDPACVAENLQRLKTHLNSNAPLLRVKQVHGSALVFALDLISAMGTSDWAQDPTVEADAIVGRGSKAVLAVQVADCVPLLLADPKTGAVAAVHAGWRGTAKGVVRKAVRALAGEGANAATMVAAIGPCICAECYEVGADVAKHFPESALPRRGQRDKYMLDLALAVEVSLIAAGLTSGRIDRIGACTSCETEALFSYRRDGPATGRTLGFIAASP